MKRDIELVRKIMLMCEVDPARSDPDGEDGAAVRYHKKLLIEAGLAGGSIVPDMTHGTEVPAAAFISGLTWSGHDFIDRIRGESTWARVKDILKRSGRELSIEAVRIVIREIAGGAA